MTSQKMPCDSCVNGNGQSSKTRVVHDFTEWGVRQFCKWQGSTWRRLSYNQCFWACGLFCSSLTHSLFACVRQFSLIVFLSFFLAFFMCFLLSSVCSFFLCFFLSFFVGASSAWPPHDLCMTLRTTCSHFSLKAASYNLRLSTKMLFKCWHGPPNAPVPPSVSLPLSLFSSSFLPCSRVIPFIR